MKCRLARYWLLTSTSVQAQPKSVRKHLIACARCRRRFRQLTEMEAKVMAAPLCTSGLQDFLRKIPDLPAHSCPSERAMPSSAAPPGRRPHPVLLYWAASILLLIGLSGWMIYLLDDSNSDQIDPDRLPRVAAVPAVPSSVLRAEDKLVTRFVQRDLILADTTAPAKQLQVLSEMADDLRSEALRLADAKAPEDVPMLAGLYERVLQRGIVGRAAALPEPSRKDLQQALARHLRRQDMELELRLRQSPPDWATLVQGLHKSSKQMADALALDEPPSRVWAESNPVEPRISNHHRLMFALVMNGLRLAEETDPLKRADTCSDLAGHLLQAVVTASVKGDQQNVSALGKHLSAFVERGVTANLARVPSDDPRVAELKDVMLRTNQIMLALDSTLDQLTSKPGPVKLEPASLDRLKELERMLKDVEKSLKKVHKAFQEEKGKGKDKDHRDENERDHEKGKSKGKGKGKSVSLEHAAPTIIVPIERSTREVGTSLEVAAIGSNAQDAGIGRPLWFGGSHL